MSSDAENRTRVREGSRTTLSVGGTTFDGTPVWVHPFFTPVGGGFRSSFLDFRNQVVGNLLTSNGCRYTHSTLHLQQRVGFGCRTNIRTLSVTWFPRSTGHGCLWHSISYNDKPWWCKTQLTSISLSIDLYMWCIYLSVENLSIIVKVCLLYRLFDTLRVRNLEF